MKVLIIGAGIMGLAAAWRLALAGASVEILDPRDPGNGATRAALGALWPASPLLTGPLQTLHRQSLRQFRAFAEEISRAARAPVSYRQLGRIEILNSPKAKLHALEEAAAQPADLGVIDFPAAQSLNPGLASFAHAALHCRITAQVNVHQLADALKLACQNAGVTFHKFPARALQHSDSRITAIETSAGPLSADAYLITAGAWTPLLSPLLAQVAAIRPVKGQGLALPMPASRPITTIIKSGPTYLIPWDSEILVGSTTEPEAAFDESATEAARQKLLAAAARILPELKSAVPLRHWAGLRPENPVKPRLPIMGPHPRFKNLHLCTGHYKTGIGLAPLASELVARSILESKIPETLLPFLPHL